MNDRELLEAAAKAAGYSVTGSYGDGGADGFWLTLEPRPFHENTGWNPLTDDGDALRLAVKLGIRLADFPDTVVPSRGVGWRQGGASCALWEPEGADPYAATRRAIVRAAATIAAREVA